MTEQEEKERFRKGFNYGYLMAQFESELLKKILSRYDRDELFCDKNPYARGMYLGREQYENERQLQPYLQRIDAAEKSGEISKEFIENELEKDRATQRQQEIENLQQKNKSKDKDRDRDR